MLNQPPPSLLLVDDVPASLRLLGQALASDYRICVALNGPDALALARGPEPPDLILLDLVMPGMDGLEVCRRLKDEDATRDIPVIFLTGTTDEAEEARCLEAGAVDFIHKPFRLPIVRARLRTHIELKQQRDMLETLSMNDVLTGLPNRRRLEERLDLEWKRASRRAMPLSAAFVDIDHFKTYNDSLGHPAGDVCLRQVARALADALKRPMDLMARYGGEEFVACLPETDADGALRVGETLRETVERLDLPHPASPVAPHVTLSVGVATLLPTPDGHPTQLIQAADQALYQAKQQGRNRVAIWKP